MKKKEDHCEKTRMKEYVQGEWLDYPLEKYLNKAEATLLKDEDGKKSIRPGEYFRIEDRRDQKRVSRIINIRRAVAAGVVLISLMILVKFFADETNYRSQRQFANISFNLLSGISAKNTDLAKLSIATADSIYTSEKISDTSFVFKKIPIDSTKPARLLVETQNGDFERPIA